MAPNVEHPEASSTPCKFKIRTTVNLTPRTEAAMSNEARRLGISFNDMTRRITDAWADLHLQNHVKPAERILVLDRDKGQLRGAR